ncbi:aminopeptidase N [Psychromicrobium lacuslunae]|uniref:Aminopeptidase N n=1 Tax=Psychromicrobium lacuslunae TaxID=1618207 RepID=A0A0D4C2N7_9MICC|nr:aminopeptidase N [Psychromicrobium lacuslunae]
MTSSDLNLSRAEAAERAETVTVHDYHVTLDLRSAREHPEAGFTTQSIITFSATPGSSTFADFVGRSVQRVNLNGIDLPLEGIYQGARIALPGLAAENQVIITATAEYSRSGEGLHRFIDPEDSKVYLYTQYEPADARRVFANFEQPDLKGRYTFEIIAPSDWQVASNGAETAVQPLSGNSELSKWSFAQTQPISTYITCVLAGEYTHFSSSWSGNVRPNGAGEAEPLEIPLGAYCRASVAKAFDAENIFELTRAGLDFLHQKFDFAYPFGKYDQAFVPEYNLGAMENPGLVTFTDSYVFTSKATDIQYQLRANVIFHEMAHMWFGDLVTMQWWDDLWLKESFADFIGTLVVAEATHWGEASWVSFANKRKVWAYRQDQLPTTHPIVADIVDLEAAKQNFDGITYAKGASVLKQLVAFVGPEAFFEASRQYFRKHAFGNTRLEDLLHELSDASGRDMSRWAAEWLQTSGISTLGAEVVVTDGVYDSVTIVQQAVDPITGLPAERDHLLNLGLYSYDASGALVRTESIPQQISGARTAVSALEGKRQPDLLLINDNDLSYAKIGFDDVSLATVLSALDRIAAPLARALCWATLWNMTRDAILPAADYLAAVIKFAPSESDDGALAQLLANAKHAIESYAPAGQREALRAELLSTAVAQLAAGPAGSGLQLAWLRSLSSVSRGSTAQQKLLRELLGGEVPEGLVLDAEPRWQILIALAANGLASAEELQGELSAQQSSRARVGFTAAMAARPQAELKAQAWQAAVEADELSNELLSATISGFRLGAEDLQLPYRERYFEALERVWASRSIEISSRIVEGLFPSQQAEPGLSLDSQPVVLLAEDWLESHQQAPAALRRLILEELDDLKRSLRAQLA